MRKRSKSTLFIRVCRAICSSVIMGSAIYILFIGFSVLAAASFAVATVTVAAPIVTSGESFLEMVASFFGALVEGVVTIIEAIADAISSLFS